MRPSALLYLSMRDSLQDITLDIVEVESSWARGWSWGGRHSTGVYVELGNEYY